MLGKTVYKHHWINSSPCQSSKWIYYGNRVGQSSKWIYYGNRVISKVFKFICFYTACNMVIFFLGVVCEKDGMSFVMAYEV